jgi:hypothetical protein
MRTCERCASYCDSRSHWAVSTRLRGVSIRSMIHSVSGRRVPGALCEPSLPAGISGSGRLVGRATRRSSTNWWARCATAPSVFICHSKHAGVFLCANIIRLSLAGSHPTGGGEKEWKSHPPPKCVPAGRASPRIITGACHVAKGAQFGGFWRAIAGLRRSRRNWTLVSTDWSTSGAAS